VRWNFMSEISFLDVELIVANKYNPNMMPPETFQYLLNDAQQHGAEALDPILVRPLDFVEGKQQYEIVDGENRWKVAKQLGWKRLRVIICKVSLEEAKSINYRKNRERGTLDPFKEAQLFKEDYDTGLTLEQIGERYGVSHAQVSIRLSLLGISEEAKAIVTRVTMDKVTPSHLELLAKVKEPEQQKELAEKIVAGDLSVRETEAEVKRVLEPPPTPTVNPFEEKHEEPYDFECVCQRRYKVDWEKKTIQEIAS